MLRRVVGLVGAALAVGLLSGLLAGCGGPPDFKPGPGKVRVSPLPEAHGLVNFPPNVTVAGTGLFLFTHGVRQLDGAFQVNLTAIPNPTGPHPSSNAVQGWLGKGDTLKVAGLVVKVTAVYSRQAEADAEVTTSGPGDGGSASVTASPDVS